VKEVFKGARSPQRHMGSTEVASLFIEQDIFLLLSRSRLLLLSRAI